MVPTEKTFVQELIGDDLDEILGVREELGADLTKVRLVTRTWAGVAAGDGDYTDVVSEMHPAPGVVDLFHAYRASNGAGTYQQGDLRLTMISKNKFPAKSDVDCSGGSKTIQKFYEVNGQLYTVIGVAEKYVYWNVDVRKHSDSRPVKTS